MQNILLDILILGLLVLLFGSIYRKHATVRLRFWLLGWLFVLVHFSLLLFTPSSELASSLVVAASEGALLLCGAAFALSFGLVWETGWQSTLSAMLLAVPGIAYVFVCALWHCPTPVLLALGAAVHAGFLAVVLRFGRGPLAVETGARPRFARWTSAFTLVAGAGWMAWEILHHQPDNSVYAIPTEIYLINAVLYWEDFRRISAGVVVSVLGLAAWGGVFPCAVLLLAIFPHLDVPGELWNVPKYFVAFGMILTLLEEQKRDADARSQQYRVLFDNNPHPMWIFDVESLQFLKVNDAAVGRYGYSDAEFMSMSLREIRPADEVEALEQTIANAASSESVLISGPWTHILRDGRRIQVEVSSHGIQFEGRRARFSLVQDVTERQQLHHQLLHQAHHDMLTGLPNRTLLLDRMEQALAAAARRGRKVAIICLDLDRFKQINDTYGHAVGDLCLKQIAERLKGRLRSADTVARSGGEEFTIVAGDLASVADAERIAEDLLSALRKPLVVDQYPIDQTASFGIAIYPDHGLDAAGLWRNADAAMYRVKRSGGNQFVLVSHEISRSTTEANELEMFMRRALKEGGFEMYYQPEYGADGSFRGLEALLRLHHPRYGMVSPDRFIPIAEESGLIVPIGNWVLREVCRQGQEWRNSGLSVERIAINVSPLQFMRMDFSRQVREVLAEFGVAPTTLEIEMTETTVMRNLDDVARQMRDLAELGVQFSVDDFGTGYSSLRHLHQLPIQTLKIDKSFVERICEPAGTSALVQAILSLAHSLGLQVVAEGVERVDQMEALLRMKCDLLQGFLFARPQPAENIPALVRSGRLAGLVLPPVPLVPVEALDLVGRSVNP
ncbi:MAG TPA: EAL domain-containing protein [Acidobacteriaceae bacterium]|jgi:diguanylate cyclase (GGDEF)-like protein/PAS domain S-box-containing protein|nr:EAL domain-containing protein [Acidobacteriaceae bacterium]